MGTVAHVFAAPERGAPVASLEEVEALAGRGLRGDRYLREENRPSPDYQVTLIELEAVEAFVRETGLPLGPGEPRRNLVTRGVRLNDLCGRHFTVGGATLEGLELCEPCRLFQSRTHPEVLRFFVHRGGLRARIVAGGVIRPGDQIRQAST
ncbi:MAG TPA: MOSC domain-containing protein [Longimicrobiaceae bacterium]